jgi:single-strand DNA-binding protein
MFERAIACVEGYLGDNPEIRKTKSGKTIVSLSIGVNRSIKSPDSEQWESKIQWFKVKVIKANLVGKAEKCFKGAYVRAEGNLELESFEKDGNTIRYTEIVLSGDGSTFSYRNKAEVKPEEANS